MSGETQIPRVVRELLGTAIRSIDELEVLLRLKTVGGPHSATELAAALKIPESLTVFALQGLVLARLVVQVGESSPLLYELASSDAELRAAVDELARVYDESRIDIILLISSNAIGRVRSRALQMFSDSFRLPNRKRSE